MGTADAIPIVKNQKYACDVSETGEEYGPNLKILPSNDQVRELQTILRDK